MVVAIEASLVHDVRETADEAKEVLPRHRGLVGLARRALLIEELLRLSRIDWVGARSRELAEVLAEHPLDVRLLVPGERPVRLPIDLDVEEPLDLLAARDRVVLAILG